MQRRRQRNQKKQMIKEKLTADTPIGDWIRDFQDSDAPQFAGASKEKRRQMAIAAYYASQPQKQIGENMSQTRALLDSIIAGDAVGIKSAFESAMSTRVAERLNSIRQATAQRMFNQK